MRNLLLTGAITFFIGLALGFYLGWVQFPVEYRNSHMCQLDENYQENYTLMVARGYGVDGDLQKAIERLRPLRVEGIPECDDGRAYKVDSIPDWVQTVTERYINAGADTRDIRDLVSLSADLGRLTPVMESFR